MGSPLFNKLGFFSRKSEVPNNPKPPLKEQFHPGTLALSTVQKPWKYLAEACTCMENAMRILYSEGAFMPKSSAMETSESGYRFLLCYSALVRWSMEQKKLLFNLVPKLHYLHHIMADLRSAAENPSVTLVYNPVGNCTSQLHRAHCPIVAPCFTQSAPFSCFAQVYGCPCRHCCRD